MIGAVIAMQCEADILLREMKREKTQTLYDKTIVTGTAFGKEIVLVVCGVGKVNAAAGAALLVDRFSADVLINFGVAGAMGERTEVCGVYQIEKAVQYDFDLAGLNGTKIGTLDECTENYLPLSTLDVPLKKRRLATGDRFNDDENDRKLLEEYMQADLRDMEGAAIAQVALHAHVPLYEWKAVSDKAGNVSSFEQYNANKLRALENLAAHFAELFDKLPDPTRSNR